MANELKALTFDVATGKSSERVLTADEIAEREAMQAQAQVRDAEQTTKSAARASALAKLADLGLTAEEIAAF